MKFGIGIDTGGTYTDAVVYDFEKKEILAKGKSLTTKENLEIGIGNALDALPQDLVKKAELLSLSTTLATNACVERKGGRAKLILLSTTRKVLEWIDAKSVYGLKDEDVLCIDTKSSFDGKIVDHPDWNEVMQAEAEWLVEAQALAVAETNALHNGGACEKKAKEKLTEQYPVPFVMAGELAANLNVMERGATALLNARLLPTIEEFMRAVKNALKKRGITSKKMIVRSDGSLMSEEHALMYPVKTILSGPAASIMGGREMADCPDSLIVDMGGTTTDISIVKENEPALTEGIRIGGFRTQISGVRIDTFGLGGDSRITVEKNRITLHSRRVQPLCVAAEAYPQLKEDLRELIAGQKNSSKPLQEALYLVKEPTRRRDYTEHELALIDMLREKPILLGSGELDLYNLSVERLENEGIVMRCGLTPTDIMHIRGDFNRYDRGASVLGARYLMRILTDYSDTEEELSRFCEEVYDKVCGKLYENIVRILLEDSFPEIFRDGVNEQIMELLRESWVRKEKEFFGVHFHTRAVLVGIGAPTHIFLPRVAEALGVQCVIPEYADVANAVGAIVADIFAQEKVTISPNYSAEGSDSVTLFATNETREFLSLGEAIEYAKRIAEEAAAAKAREQGALGELKIRTEVNTKVVNSREGATVNLDTTVTAYVTGRV